MKLKSTTIALLLLALGLGGFVYLYEVQGAPKREESKSQEKQIFDFEEKQVQALTVKTGAQTLSFVKASPAAKPSPSPKKAEKADNKSPAPSPTASQWQMTDPDKMPADDAAIAYLLNLLATGQSDRTLTVPANRAAEFGLDNPVATVEVKLDNQKTHRLILGKPNFDQSFIYAQTDPPAQGAQELDVLLVSTDFTNAVNRPLSEWQQQPEPAPSPTPESDKASDPQASSPSPNPAPTENTAPEETPAAEN